MEINKKSTFRKALIFGIPAALDQHPGVTLIDKKKNLIDCLLLEITQLLRVWCVASRNCSLWLLEDVVH